MSAQGTPEYPQGPMRFSATWKGQGGAYCTTDVPDPREALRTLLAQRDALAQQLADTERMRVEACDRADALARELERLADAAECMAERGSNPQRTKESIPWALYARSARAALAGIEVRP